MRRLVSTVVAGLAVVMVAACGAAHVKRDSATSRSLSYANTPQAKLGGATPAEAARMRGVLLAKIAWVHSSHQPRLGNDGDNDQPGDEDHDNNRDTGGAPGSIDPYVDYLPPADNRAYHDEDDQLAAEWGRAATSADLQAVETVVERYYVALSRGEGAKGCALMAPTFAKAVPIDYGKFGPSYLHGGKTCAAVLTLLFEHLRAQLREPIEVTQVRVSGSTAMAFLGAVRMRASELRLVNQGGSWKIDQLTAAPLL